MSDSPFQDNAWENAHGDETETVAKRNPWLWIGLPIGCIGVLLLVCGGSAFTLVYGVSALIKSSEPYRYALQRVEDHGGTAQKLGTPIEPGSFLSGSIQIYGEDGEADFLVPLSGPGGTASLRVVASKEAGQWSYAILQVTFGNDTDERIDLLE